MFGLVVEGVSMVKNLETVEVDERDVPTAPIQILSMAIEENVVANPALDNITKESESDEKVENDARRLITKQKHMGNLPSRVDY